MGSYRRRMIWPSFLSDSHVQKLPREARLLLLAHILTADDEGRGDLDAEDWKALVFPRDDDVDEDRIETELLPLLWRLKKRKGRALVEPFEVDACLYWHLPRWFNYQRVDRPTPSKVPSPSEGVRPGGLPSPGGKRKGKAPTPEQWELILSMSEERGTTLAKIASGLGLQVDDILARDVTRIRQAIEEIEPTNGKDAIERRISGLAREARTAIQLGKFEVFAEILERCPDRDWSKLRSKIVALDSGITGKSRAAVYESTRKVYE